MPFQIIRNDITKVKADAIVNTANPWPEVGGGTDWAIHNAAGPELLAARQEIGEISVGQSVATDAFALPAKYVLHTVSPVWLGGQFGEKALLRKAYDAALTLAETLGCKSIAFPLMAAGTYSFPHSIALSIAINAFTEFLFDHKIQIYLVLFNAEAFDIAGSIFDDLESYIDDNYVSDRAEEEYRIDESAGFINPEYHRVEEYFKKKKTALPKDAICAASMLPEPPSEGLGIHAESLEEMLSTQHESTFTEHLMDLLIEKDLKNSEVYNRACISKALFSKILKNKDYQPKKNTAIQLAIGLMLDLPQTQKFLEKAGYTLTRGSKVDLVVQYCIERELYSVVFINEILDDCGLPLLNTGLKP